MEIRIAQKDLQLRRRARVSLFTTLKTPFRNAHENVFQEQAGPYNSDQSVKLKIDLLKSTSSTP